MADKVKFPQHSEEELSDFLSKVTEIESTIKGLNSDDEERRAEYMSKADKLIEKVEADREVKEKKKEAEKKKENDDDVPLLSTGFNRTSINKDAYKNEPVGPPSPATLPMQQPQDQPIDQAAFMAAMEADAKERAERKKEREKVAAVLKEKGNAEFKQGNFEKALDFYNQAIQEVKDSSALYTNRAQTRIRLGLYEEALSDCDWALRAWPNCMKAYVHQGHAYLHMKQYDKARDSYKEILTLDSKKEPLVQEYIAQVDRSEQANLAEEKASQLFESGDEAVKSVVDLLTKVAKTDQLPLFYAGGFRVIASVLTNVDTQTLFRTNRGLSLPIEHTVLKRYLSSPIVSLSKEERDVLTAALDMMTVACKDNETNQQQLMGLPDFPLQLMAILDVRVKGQGRMLRSSCLNLLHEVSTTSAGQTAIVTHFNLVKLIHSLFPLMTKNSSYASTAAAIFNNIALDKRVKIALRDNVEETFLPAFESLLNNNKTAASIASLASCTATNLATDPLIRNKMAARLSLWNVAAQCATKYSEGNLTEPLESLLGLLVNMSTGVEAASLSTLPISLCSTCCHVLSRSDPSSTQSDSPECLDPTALTPTSLLTQRALAFLSNVMVHCASFTQFIAQDQRALMMLDFMKSEDSALSKAGLKCVVALTKDSDKVCNLLADHRVTSVLLTLLNNSDETAIGNAALCLSHLSSVAKVSSKLTKTNIIQKLLTLARDARNSGVQSNCAILVGKLVQSDERHHLKLQELGGFQILHNCMKYVKT